MTFCVGPTWTAFTWKPALCRSWVALLMFSPLTLGMGTVVPFGVPAPVETSTVTVEPEATGVPGAGDWLVMIPAGWLELLSCCTFRVMPLGCAHPAWTACASWPVRLGSGRPPATCTYTTLLDGQEVPA